MLRSPLYRMAWEVKLHDEFEAEFERLPEEVQDELLARLEHLKERGPMLGRPYVDTLNGSSFNNMKEIRFKLDGVWRFAFAFDQNREAIILVGGDKEGENQSRFYRELIKKADERFAKHIATLKQASHGSKL